MNTTIGLHPDRTGLDVQFHAQHHGWLTLEDDDGGFLTIHGNAAWWCAFASAMRKALDAGDRYYYPAEPETETEPLAQVACDVCNDTGTVEGYGGIMRACDGCTDGVGV